jgi:dipeptidyl aminopeptidase/acylaminoacyl peptidase
LIPAAFLHQADFNVVLFDLRDHGDSTVEDGLVSAGQREWRDVVAVWSWLQEEKGAEPQSIGLYGVSLGAGTAAIAFDQEKDIEAVFLESTFSSMDKIIKEELAFGGFPAFLKDAAVFAGKVSSGDNLVKYEPLSAAENIGNRSMFITQSEEDYRIKLHHSKSMCETAEANVAVDGHVECWFASSSIAHNDDGEAGILSHVTLMLTQPDAYRDHLVDFFETSLASGEAVV